MNLFNLHTNPEELLWYEEQYKLPENAFNEASRIYRSGGSYDDIKHLEKLIKNGDYESYAYAKMLGGRFRAGEDAIAHGDPNWAWKYVDDILQEPWPEAEETIFKDRWYRILYYTEFPEYIMKQQYPDINSI